MRVKIVKIVIVKFYFLIVLFGCDFTPRIHREVLEAQDILSSQDYKKAVKKYEKILVLNPSDPIKVKIYFQLGELYHIYFLDYEKAINSFSRIQDLTHLPKYQIKAKEKIADIYFSFLNKFNKSAQIYKKLEAFRPKLEKYNLYRYRLAVSYLNLSKSDKAKEIFELILKEKKGKYKRNAQYNLGLVYFHNKNWLRAIKTWKKYIKVESKQSSVIQTKFLIGNAYESIENLKEAYNYYYSVLGEFPNTQVVLNRLNSVYERRVARKR